jgi:hypothetical protein
MMMFIVGAFLLSAVSVYAVPDWKLQKKLYDYIVRDDVKNVNKMLEEHPSFAKKKIQYHTYPVFEAAKFGAMNALKALVGKGAVLTVRDSRTGDTIIHYMFTDSRTKNREKILNYLINENKLRMDTTNKAKLTPFLVLFGTTTCPVSEKRAEELVPIFKKFRANLNAKDKAGMAALHYLSKIGRMGSPVEKTNMRNQRVAMVLLKYGANPNITDKDKRTPLINFLLSSKKLPDDMKVEYINCLLDYGANPKAKSKKKETPLKLVEKKGKLYMMLKKRHKKKKPLK